MSEKKDQASTPASSEGGGDSQDKLPISKKFIVREGYTPPTAPVILRPSGQALQGGDASPAQPSPKPQTETPVSTTSQGSTGEPKGEK